MSTADMTTADIDHLVSQLSTQEKVSLVSLADFWHTAAVPRLDIRPLRLSDGPNGVRGPKFFNGKPGACFPCGTAMGATWNVPLLTQAGQLMAAEAVERDVDVILGPTCNIQRGPLGGRGFESFAEDPYLSGMCAAAIINGIQDGGDVAATIKHYVCNDLEDERNSINAIVSERALREVYLLPFQVAIEQSNPRAVMTSYNKVNGEHVSNSKKFLTDILRDEWRWDGLVMSDWFGVYSETALAAGLDLECPGPARLRKHDSMLHQIKAREISELDLDRAVRNILAIGRKTGRTAPQDLKLLRDVAAEAVVLLRNDRSLLPLTSADRVAVIGPNAKAARANGGGSASLNPYYTTNVYDSMPSGCTFAQGAVIEDADLGRLMGTVTAKVYGDRVDGVLLEELQLASTKIWLFDYKPKGLEGDVFYMTLSGTFTPEADGTYVIKESCLGTAQVFVDGEMVIDDKTKQELGSAAIGAATKGYEARLELKKGRAYAVRIEYGSAKTFTLQTMDLVAVSGGGLLDVGIVRDRTERELIDEAVAVAAAADKVVLCVGTSAQYESEGFDRKDMDLPGSQQQLVEAVMAANANVVLVNLSGTPVTLPYTPGLVQGWFNGCDSGPAIADVLYGRVNPSGKLPLTFPASLEDNPAFLTHMSSYGHVMYGEDVFVGYRYYEKVKRAPLFAFGHGLSYTTFELSEPVVSSAPGVPGLTVTVSVTNTGSVAGKEVVQVYTEPPASMDRPNKELKGFAKVELAPGETKRVDIAARQPAYYNPDRRAWVEDKTFEVLVGTSSAGPFLTAAGAS